MKLRTRIVIGFTLIICIPMLLFMIAFYGVSQNQKQRGNVSQSDPLVITMPNTTYDIIIQGKSSWMEKARVRLSTVDMTMLLLLILFLSASIIGVWIYQSFAAPLVKLKVATKNIRDGNLNFTLDVRGDDEIAELFRDFEDMRIRLKESAEEKLRLDEEQKELISNISHDLKTPLTAIKGYAEGILDGVPNTPEKLHQYAMTVYQKAEEMDILLNELTLYSKIDMNRMPYRFEMLPVEAYFEERAQEMTLDLRNIGIEMVYENKVPKGVYVLGDGEQLRRVLNNLVSNAIKYQDMKKEKSVVIFRVREVEDYIQVEVGDNGIGIAEENLKYIFDRFYRGDSSRNSTMGGSGIGLSIVRKIIEDNGGRVWATSRKGYGTTIYFVLRKARIEEL